MIGTEKVEIPEAPESKPKDENQIYYMFLNIQQILVELHEDKKMRYAAPLSKASNKDKGKGKADKPPSPPLSPS